jgi:hypothetical protein
MSSPSSPDTSAVVPGYEGDDLDLNLGAGASVDERRRYERIGILGNAAIYFAGCRIVDISAGGIAVFLPEDKKSNFQFRERSEIQDELCIESTLVGRRKTILAVFQVARIDAHITPNQETGYIVGLAAITNETRIFLETIVGNRASSRQSNN